MKDLLRRLRGWCRRNYLPLTTTALVLLLVFVYLIPSIFVTIGPGRAGVLWRRFGLFGIQAGTVEDTWYHEGLRVKLPWDRMYVYNVRLQDHTKTYAALAKNGLPIDVEISVRFRALEWQLGSLHRYVGPDYINTLIVPEVGAHARYQIGQLEPEELYTSRRAEIQGELYRHLVRELQIQYAARRSLFGEKAVLRRQTVLTIGALGGRATVAQIAAHLGVDERSLRQDIDALVKDGLLASEPGPDSDSTTYHVHRRTVADSRDLDDLISQGSPLVYVEDVLIRTITLPETVREAIEAKAAMEQQMKEWTFRVLREEKEKERKIVEAEGIRAFQDIVSEGISEQYLKWKGIDATLELAKSPNSKVVVIGGGPDGLPLILGPLGDGVGAAPTHPRTDQGVSRVPGTSPPPR